MAVHRASRSVHPRRVLFIRRHEQKITQHGGHVVRRDMPENMLVDLHGHRQHAATQAGDFAQREQPVRRRVVSVRDLQIRFEGLVCLFSTFDIASRSDADFYMVLSGWLEAKRLIEARHAVDAVERDVQPLA